MKKLQETHQTKITRLSHDGRGIGHCNGKTVFIAGALPEEEVTYKTLKTHQKYNEGEIISVLSPSPSRVTPKCPYTEICGGCAIQHIDTQTQLTYKQQMLLDHLQHFGGIVPKEMLPMLRGESFGYRRKARLGVKYVRKKSAVLVGFREKNGRYLADIHSCDVLDPRVGTRIDALRQLVSQLTAFENIPQIEVAIGDECCALIFRHMVPLVPSDIEVLKNYGQENNMWIYLQPNDTNSVHRIWPLPDESTSLLSYNLPDYGVTLQFHPTDFTQVNASINRQMVNLALNLLALEPTDHVLDLFCGLGNFTLPLAKKCAHVTGVEGDLGLVNRARDNAQLNNISNVEFYVSNLADISEKPTWLKKAYDKILLDPPRSGALELIPLLPLRNTKRIVYVSCNPATLARDAKELGNAGFSLTQAGIMDMFPHTQHIESIAVFVNTRHNSNK